MAGFLISNTLNNNIFFTSLSEIENRLDPLFYVAVKKIKKDIVSKAKYNCQNLIKACSIKRGRFGHRPRNDPRFYHGDYPFIQTGDIVKAANTNNQIEYSQTLNELGLKTSKLFNPPQLLFTIAANIGDTAILDFPSCFPDSIVALIPKNKDEISINYLNHYLTLIKSYVIDLAPYAAQRNLNNQQLAQVPVIIPPLKIQDSIVKKIELAYESKFQKEQRAKDLLAGIDDYLLGELGITLPKKDGSLESRVFTTKLSEVSGGRIDPKLYDNNTRALKRAIEKTHFNKVKLKDLIIHSVAGNWGKDEMENLADDYTKCLVIRATEFDNIYNLNLDNSRVKYRLIHNDKLRRMDIQLNDLLIEKSGGSPDQPVGRISILTNEIINQNIIGFSNFIHKIRINSKKLNPTYLFYYLKTIHNIKLTEAMQSQTNGIRNLIMANYFNQIIPLPDLSKQESITNKIDSIKQQAQQMQKEAIEVLERAKKEVEGLILGE